MTSENCGSTPASASRGAVEWQNGMDEQLLQTWGIHNRLLRSWLAAVPEEALALAPTTRDRRIGDHFAHLHNNRLDWLRPAAPEERIAKVSKADAVVKAVLEEALQASEEAVARLVRQSLAAEGKMKAFKPHAVAFTGYLLVHEGYHLGKIDFLLRQARQAPDDQSHYALWQWARHTDPEGGG